MQKIYSVYIGSERKKENKALWLLLEAVGCFVLGFCLSGFLWVIYNY